MAFEGRGSRPLDYEFCQYGRSRLRFRGPARRTDGRYLAFLGGSETFGKFVAQPFPALVEAQLDTPCLNLSVMNGGVDALVHDTDVPGLAANASLAVVQVVGAQNMSNRFYTVHPRRNDRFLNASTLLKTIYREVDFTEFSFTRHMLTALRATCPDRFSTIEEELRVAWLARMRLLLSRIETKTLLLWITNSAGARSVSQQALGPDPLFVDQDMIDSLVTPELDILRVEIPPNLVDQGRSEMQFSSLDAAAAMEMMSPGAHKHIADQLVTKLNLQRAA